MYGLICATVYKPFACKVLNAGQPSAVEPYARSFLAHEKTLPGG